jgi:hypothetical protein
VWPVTCVETSTIQDDRDVTPASGVMVSGTIVVVMSWGESLELLEDHRMRGLIEAKHPFARSLKLGEPFQCQGAAGRQLRLTVQDVHRYLE